ERSEERHREALRALVRPNPEEAIAEAADDRARRADHHPLKRVAPPGAVGEAVGDEADQEPKRQELDSRDESHRSIRSAALCALFGRVAAQNANANGNGTDNGDTEPLRAKKTSGPARR